MTEKKIHGNSKYKPEYCERVIEMGKLGYSKEQMSSALNCDWDCFDNWSKRHEEFKVALRTAIQEELSYWEALGLQNILEVPGGSRLNGAVYNKVMAARFPRKYSERNKVELTGTDGGPVQIENTHSLGQEILSEILGSLQSANKEPSA
jgi:hypothetical protein